MNINQQGIAFYTLVRREVTRMFRIASQVFLPPVITTGLYFLIFGSMIGRRIGDIHDIPYTLFIAPGLILMSVITNAYGNVSTSLFSLRFQRSIEEMLVSPMHNWLILFGFITGGMLRGLIVAFLVSLVASFFVSFDYHHIVLAVTVVLMVSALFSLAGFTNAMLARNFDDVMIIPTFVLAPLTYLGGVFYSLDMLPPFWQRISELNPVFYMIQAMRYAMTGNQSIRIGLSMSIILSMLVCLIVLNMIMLKKGVGLRD